MELLGKEAAVFVTSGTMGNLVSLMAHVPAGWRDHRRRRRAHRAGRGGRTCGGRRGVRAHHPLPAPTAGWIRHAIREAFRDPDDPHEPITALVAIENTHAHSMGQPLDAAYIAQVARVAHEGGVPLHMDGARLFNAAVALGVPARELAAPADSVTFCLSKGLACPWDRWSSGSRDFIRRARRARKLLGGGLRQVGVLAAPGLIALRDGPAGMIERLAEDHANARRLADGLAGIPGVRDLDPARVRTDFVLFRVADRAAFVDGMAARRGVDERLRPRPSPRGDALRHRRRETSSGPSPRHPGPGGDPGGSRPRLTASEEIRDRPARRASACPSSRPRRTIDWRHSSGRTSMSCSSASRYSRRIWASTTRTSGWVICRVPVDWR